MACTAHCQQMLRKFAGVQKGVNAAREGGIGGGGGEDEGNRDYQKDIQTKYQRKRHIVLRRACIALWLRGRASDSRLREPGFVPRARC